MVNIKSITLHYADKTGTAMIASYMTAQQIYHALYDAVGYFVGASEIIILEHESNEKANLSYSRLKEGRPYRVVKSESQMQGPGIGSSSAQHTVQNVAYILEHWGLQHASQIFGGMIPAKDPNEWPRTFSQELRIFAKQTRGRFAEAIQLLTAENNKRRAGDEDAPVEVTTADIKNARKEKTRRVAIGAWIEVEENNERSATKVFAGGWSDGLDSVEKESVAEPAKETNLAQAALTTLAMLPSRRPGE